MLKKGKYTKSIFYGIIYALLSPLFYLFFILLKIDLFKFELIIFSFGSLACLLLLINYFKKIDNNYVKEGLIISLILFFVIPTVNTLGVLLINDFFDIHFGPSELKRAFLHLIPHFIIIINFIGVGYLLEYKSK